MTLGRKISDISHGLRNRIKLFKSYNRYLKVKIKSSIWALYFKGLECEANRNQLKQSLHSDTENHSRGIVKSDFTYLNSMTLLKTILHNSPLASAFCNSSPPSVFIFLRSLVSIFLSFFFPCSPGFPHLFFWYVCSIYRFPLQVRIFFLIPSSSIFSIFSHFPLFILIFHSIHHHTSWNGFKYVDIDFIPIFLNFHKSVAPLMIFIFKIF